MTTFSETTLPVLIGTLPAGQPKGDVSALGRLTVNEAQAVDQWWVTWGIETNDLYTHTDSTGSGALFYEAESRTALGGSAIAAGPSGASGAGSNVMRNTTLSTTYQAILSTQATGGGAHLTHVGTFRVYARFQAPTSNTGTVSVALQWALGDFHRSTENASKELSGNWEGSWRLVDLGLVSIPKVLSGAQRWEGRILAKSTGVSDDLDVDYLVFVPTDVASGIDQGVSQIQSPSLITAHDEFDQAAGALTTKTLPVGGAWAGAGDADDFNVTVTSGSVTGIVTRTAVSDADVNTGRYAIAGTSTFTSAMVQIDMKRSALVGTYQGALARYTDTNNWLMATVTADSAGTGVYQLLVRKRVAGTVTTMFTLTLPTVLVDTYYTMLLVVDTGGRWYVWVVPQGFPLGTPTASDVDSVLATGGTLASGKSGFYDAATSATAVTRTYDNFIAAAGPGADAAMFASQSLEVRWDGVIREDSAGVIWQPVSSHEGDLLRVPVTGREGRSIRFIVKACRNDPTTGPDSGIDDINATLAVTPRYLSVPTPV